MKQEKTISENIINNRDYWFDNAKAFLIFLVVIGHMAEVLVGYTDFVNGVPGWLNTLLNTIYIFHMPVFLIVSGRFAKNRIDKNDWITVINKLLIPYLVIYVVMLFYTAFLKVEAPSRLSIFAPPFGLWYIFNVTIYQLITPCLKQIKGIFCIALVMSVIIQFAESAPLGGLMRLVTYYPFFLFGYFGANKELKFCRKTWFRVISVMAFALLVIIVWKNPQYFKVGALTLRRVYGSVSDIIGSWSKIDFLVFTIIRYSVCFAMFFFVLGICPKKKIFCSYIGTYSVYVYELHLFFILLFRYLEKHYGFLDWFNNDKKALVFILMSIPLAMVLASAPVRNKMRWLVAPKFDLRKLVAKLIEKELN